MSIRNALIWLLSNRETTSRSKSIRREHFRQLVVEQMEDRRLLAVLDLATLTASQGTKIFGVDAGDFSGFSVSSAGDFNGDGFDDVVISANPATTSSYAEGQTGETYVLFGTASSVATIDLANLGSAGITITGVEAGNDGGFSVSGAGDVNGDGFDDLIIGASAADAAGDAKFEAGESYVIFGAASLPQIINLTNLGTLGPTVGITIFGADSEDLSGVSVSSAGDVNGDGFDDLIVGAPLADSFGNLKSMAGESYIIFGAASLPATIDLANLGVLGPTVGITIFGVDSSDWSGFSVSSAGDVNGDGFDDLIIGAFRAGAVVNAKFNAGESYVVFGAASLPTSINLSTLGVPGLSGGVTIFGADAFDYSGRTVSSAGDVNGDGFDDLIVGAPLADVAGNNKTTAGESYVIFGAASLPWTINLANLGSLGPTVGITIFGADANDLSGISVSGAGDINGDGFDDMLIGAYGASAFENTKSAAGESYLIFGAASLTTNIDLGNLGASGVTIFGADTNDRSGISVSNAGDVNGDGLDDLIIGAFRANGNNSSEPLAGESYLIFGNNAFTSSVTHLGTAASETLIGTSASNRMVGGRGDDTLRGNGGADVLIGGMGNDILAVSDLSFKRIVGGNGNDTLRLDGSGQSLNLTTLRDNRIIDIETIDISGSDNNTLTLSYRDVVNISSTTNTLLVRRNFGDVVNRGAGWVQLDNEFIAGVTFEVYQQGIAKLKIQVLPVIVDFGNSNYKETGAWVNSSIIGFNGTTTRFANSSNANALWGAPSLAAGYYEVAIWKIAVAGNSTNAQVSVVHNGIEEPPRTLNLATGASGFVSLGTFFFSGSPGEYVKLSQGTVVANLRADAVSFTRTATANVAPTINAPTTQAVDGNSFRVFSIGNANSIRLADVDTADDQVQLSVSATVGVLTLASTNGITFISGGNSQASFTIRGILENLNTALNGLIYEPSYFYFGTAAIQLTLNDLGNTGTGGAKSVSRSIALTVSNPVFVVDNGTTGYAETGSWVNSAISGFNGTSTRFANAANATATWNAPNFSPGYYSVGIWKVAIPSNSSTARVTISHNGITEPAQTINLSTVGSGFVTLGTFFFSGAPGEFVRLSQGPTVGNLRADSVRFARLPSLNAAPTILAPLNQLVASNTALVFSTTNANSITVGDVDAGVAQMQLTFTAFSGLLTLPSTTGLTFLSGINGQANFTVRGTLSNLNTALNGLRYQPNLNFTGSASIRLTLRDLGNTGFGGEKSVSHSISVTVIGNTFVVDNGTPGYVETGAWVNSTVTGYDGTNTRFANASNAVATWNAPTLPPGIYSVAIWRVAAASNSNSARVTIVHNGITESPLTVDLSSGVSGFIELGEFYFSGVPGEQVRLSQGTTIGNLRADAVRFTRVVP